MQPFTIVELSIFVIGIMSSFGGLLTIVQHSKCEEVRCCCISCKRPKEAIMADVEAQHGEEQRP